MKELFEAVGQIIRFPFFIGGLFLWLLILVPLDTLIFLYGAITTPLAFLAAAFKNDQSEFKSHFDMMRFELSRESFNGLVRWQRGRPY